MQTVFVCFLLVTQCVNLDPEQPATKKEKAASLFSVPGHDYAISLDLRGFNITEDRLNDKKTGRYVMAVSDKKHISLSFWLEPAKKKGDSKVCRETMWSKEAKNPAAEAKEIKMREKGDLAIVDYVIDEGLPLSNVRAYLAFKNTWVDIHISTTSPGEKTDKEIDRILSKVKMVEGANSDAYKEMVIGSRFYRNKDYKNAAIHYQKAVDEEKKKRSLSQTYWRVTVDNLAISYGVTGVNDQAKKVLHYGIKEDPDYPNFHYTLACVYAETDDLPHALKELKRAYELKHNVIAGEKLSDPRTDSSFKKYLETKEFKDAMKEIGL